MCERPQSGLVSTHERAKPGPIHRLEGRLIDRLSRDHLTTLSTAAEVGPSAMSKWRALAALVVLPVHTVSLALAIGGAAVVISGTTWPLKVGGGMLILLALGTRPSLPRMPQHVLALGPGEAPVLFGLWKRWQLRRAPRCRAW